MGFFYELYNKKETVMDVINFETTDEKFLITIDKNSMDGEFVFQLVERLRLEYLSGKVNFKSDGEKLGEEIKESWWKKNKLRLLGEE